MSIDVSAPSAEHLLGTDENGRDVPFEIRTDSLYAIGMLQKGHKAKANQELIARIKAKLQARTNTTLQYVPGHAKVPGNERADELAREAIVAGRDRPLTKV